MKAIHRGGRSTKIAVALGALLVTTSCAGINTPYPQQSSLPPRLDGGVGQLLRYCEKFYDSGDLVTAAAMCERAHNLDPENPAPLYQLAEILDAMEAPQQAIVAYRRVLDTDPGNVEARYRLGRQYVSMQDYDLAADEFRAGLRQNPNDPRLYNALGIANGLHGDHLAAQEAFRQGLAVDPSHVSLRNNLALSLVLNGDHEQGIAMLEELGASSLANDTTRENLQLAYDLRAKSESDANLAQDVPDDDPQPAGDDLPGLAMTSQRESDPSAKSSGARNAVNDDAKASGAGSDQKDDPIALDMAMRPKQSAMAAPAPESAATADQSDEPRRFGAIQTARAATPDAPESYQQDTGVGDYLSASMTGDAEAATSERSQGQSLAALAPSYGNGEYEVQLASYRNEADAVNGWSELGARAGATLDGLDPVIRRADLGPDKGIFYRLRTPGFAKDDAMSLCQSLKAQGIDCLVVRESAARPVDSAAQGDTNSTL